MLTAPRPQGTFHATCARFLRRNAQAVGLQNNFSICDADEAKKIVKTLLREKKATLEALGLPSSLKVEQVMSEISRAKAKDMSPDAYMDHLHQISAGTTSGPSGRRIERTEVRRAAAELYVHYQAHLATNNAVDFDDLLVYGVRLLRNKPNVTANVRHVCVVCRSSGTEVPLADKPKPASSTSFRTQMLSSMPSCPSWPVPMAHGTPSPSWATLIRASTAGDRPRWAIWD